MKKVETAPHHAWKKLSALMMTLALILTLLPAALAVDLNVDVGFYFKQSRGGTCTLASAAMMLRRRAYFDGLDGWVDVTENSIKSTAWAGGLSHSFTYNAMHVGYATLPSGKAANHIFALSAAQKRHSERQHQNRAALAFGGTVGPAAIIHPPSAREPQHRRLRHLRLAVADILRIGARRAPPVDRAHGIAVRGRPVLPEFLAVTGAPQSVIAERQSSAQPLGREDQRIKPLRGALGLAAKVIGGLAHAAARLRSSSRRVMT